MFCSHCGVSLADTAVFCSSCGKQVGAAAPQIPPTAPVQQINDQMQYYQAQKIAYRKSEINALEKAIAYFSQRGALFKEYDYVCGRVNHFARGARSALLVWGCIMATIGLLCMLICYADPTYESREAAMPLLMFTGIPGAIMILGGILMKVSNRRNFKKALDEYGTISCELYNFYAAYPDCPVGAEYANPEILTKLLKLLQSGRTDAIKDSINMAIGGRRQARIASYLSTTGKHTAQINAQTHVPVIFVAGSLFD